jgi:uncharacterized damage-inducible protein DinB
MQWFERQFEFPFPPDIHACLVERLDGLLPRVRAKIDVAPATLWTARDGERWSAQENLGHLTDLEELWQGRLDDFGNGAEVLRPADLENGKTHAANHNDVVLAQVVADLETARATTIERLQRLAPQEFGKVSRHPRLDAPMRLVDLLFFVAEHDDHHLARVSELLRR